MVVAPGAAKPAHDAPSRPQRRLFFWLRRGAAAVCGAVLFYGVFLLLGYVPVNSDFTSAPPEKRVVVFVRSNDVHTDLILPVTDGTSATDWRTVFPPEHFAADVRRDRYLAVGWGNRAFYMETPRWEDLKIRTALGALFLPSETVLHVEYLPTAAEDAWTRELHISPAQYQVLVEHVRASIRTPEAGGRPVLAGETTYGRRDRFYVANGRYHLFNTCNQWTGRGLKRAGLPTGLWTPLRSQVMRRLPQSPATPKIGAGKEAHDAETGLAANPPLVRPSLTNPAGHRR